MNCRHNAAWSAPTRGALARRSSGIRCNLDRASRPGTVAPVPGLDAAGAEASDEVFGIGFGSSGIRAEWNEAAGARTREQRLHM